MHGNNIPNDLDTTADAVRKAALSLYFRSPNAYPNHRYLREKRIGSPFPLKLETKKARKQDAGSAKRFNEWLVIPLFDAVTGEFQAVQRINQDGHKLFMPGAKVKGACVLPYHYGLDALNGKTTPLLIAEGYATAAAVMNATGWPTLAAMYAYNLQPVAEAMRQHYPNREIIIAGDNDSTGRDCACMAALAVDGKVAFPDETEKDFCDLRRRGSTAVVAKINAAEPPPPRDNEAESEPHVSHPQGDVTDREIMLTIATLQVIPPATKRCDRVYIGMAAWRATNGDHEALKAWRRWLQRAFPTDPKIKLEIIRRAPQQWRRFRRSLTKPYEKPTVGLGTLMFIADRVDPKWRHRPLHDLLKEGV
jgi:hypothetical protein